jgi:RNA recognition motif-containing protein
MTVTEKQVTDFFSFCGKIQHLELKPDGGSFHSFSFLFENHQLIQDKQKAIITFERPSAARTALLLQDAHLGTSQVKVSSSAPLDGSSTPPHENQSSTDHDFSQEDKPRTAVVAGNPPPAPTKLTFRILVTWLHPHRSSLAKGN